MKLAPFDLEPDPERVAREKAFLDGAKVKTAAPEPVVAPPVEKKARAPKPPVPEPAAPSARPWEGEGADTVKPMLVRATEGLHAKLNYILDHTPRASLNKLAVQALEEFCDRRIKEIDG